MQEKEKKKKLQKLFWEREREGDREARRNNFSVMENYAKNGRENKKFIEDSVNMKRQNKWKDD